MTLTKEELRARFEALLPGMREVAWNLGYALGAHGSFTRDMDLIGVPWITVAAPPLRLAEALAIEVEGRLHAHAASRPHGRLSWVIYPPFHGRDDDYRATGYIDLSVMAPYAICELQTQR